MCSHDGMDCILIIILLGEGTFCDKKKLPRDVTSRHSLAVPTKMCTEVVGAHLFCFHLFCFLAIQCPKKMKKVLSPGSFGLQLQNARESRIRENQTCTNLCGYHFVSSTQLLHPHQDIGGQKAMRHVGPPFGVCMHTNVTGQPGGLWSEQRKFFVVPRSRPIACPYPDLSSSTQNLHA